MGDVDDEVAEVKGLDRRAGVSVEGCVDLVPRVVQGGLLELEGKQPRLRPNSVHKHQNGKRAIGWRDSCGKWNAEDCSSLAATQQSASISDVRPDNEIFTIADEDVANRHGPICSVVGHNRKGNKLHQGIHSSSQRKIHSQVEVVVVEDVADAIGELQRALGLG